ncbi:hypothetical protein SAMN02745181_3282 [Rubritalea squalenifaciens DSM 18772]|uniref:Cbb3-type cytochrome oxidase component FixQ n=2 Tax=Rubritalea TaxID=361050 RepID=A0A1M6PSQ4_9BACT|nr:hypothetical protein [Rubritalea squalenifaciens]SHK10921.1 hypothetical protein SAMN02745181_3282 [Rubritalea squalenifaciens DSM 18772]
MIKNYVLQNPQDLAAIVFFFLTLGIFIFNIIYAVRMKKDHAEAIAKTVIDHDE